MQTAHTFTIKKIAEIDVDAAYRSPYVDTNSRFSSIYYADMGISKKILKNKGRVRFYVSDIFNTASSINFIRVKNSVIRRSNRVMLKKKTGSEIDSATPG